MNRSKAIQLLRSEGWTKADADRALVSVDFKVNPDPDEIIIRQATSKFAGTELIKRQRLQASQKKLVTQKSNLIEEYIAQIEQYKQNENILKANLFDMENQIIRLTKNLEEVIKENKELLQNNKELTKANDLLKKDNKALKNIVDMIKFKLTVEVKHLLRYEDSEIRKSLIKLLQSTLG